MMEERSKLEKSTGSLPSGKMENASGLPLPSTTPESKELPVSKNAPTGAGSTISTGGVSASPKNLLAILLAVQIMIGDYQAVQAQAPDSQIASRNGKIYFSVEVPGILLTVEKGNLLVNGVPAGKLLADAA